MRVVHIVCPKCKIKKTTKYDQQNLCTYTEKTVYIKCPKCRKLPDAPEEKLLKALFGR